MFFSKKKSQATNVDEIIRKSEKNLKHSQDINNNFAALSGEFLKFAQQQNLTVRF